MVAYRTEVFENPGVKGSEFLRKVKAVARRKKLAYHWVAEGVQEATERSTSAKT
jgi:hypothetical protein